MNDVIVNKVQQIAAPSPSTVGAALAAKGSLPVRGQGRSYTKELQRYPS